MDVQRWQMTMEPVLIKETKCEPTEYKTVEDYQINIALKCSRL